MDMKTLRTGQEQFVWTANHWTKVIQPIYSVFTSETVGRMSREFSAGGKDASWSYTKLNFFVLD